MPGSRPGPVEVPVNAAGLGADAGRAAGAADQHAKGVPGVRAAEGEAQQRPIGEVAAATDQYPAGNRPILPAEHRVLRT
ncbi:hypothetical protein GCM10010964_34690 [Caldovatus sediminis]|uniref:Uncharacterized protein n=1 Tax=Caldovatus sediminis TaxID=2041189 RepID=A0A8J2ZE86_9PROT|nr:hypothetical protein GCM10010964_34690 [Caldovatus sediminis]